MTRPEPKPLPAPVFPRWVMAELYRYPNTACDAEPKGPRIRFTVWIKPIDAARIEALAAHPGFTIHGRRFLYASIIGRGLLALEEQYGLSRRLVRKLPPEEAERRERVRKRWTKKDGTPREGAP